MKVILFGATGMVGDGVLRACLADPAVDRVLTVGRTATGRQHAKLHEIVHRDLLNLAPIETDLAGYDACFFCLGVSSWRMSEADYRRITYDITLAVATALVRHHPGMTFCYVSGMGTDSSEHGRTMWARVKGETENALLRLPLDTYLLRPGYIHPTQGSAASKTRIYRLAYTVTAPLYPVLKALVPNYVTTPQAIGVAMIMLAQQGAQQSAPARVIEGRDINAIAAATH